MRVDRELAVVVAGGGPAGAAAAIVLGREGHHPLLADEPGREAARVGEALPPAATPLLRDLGVLDRFLADGHLPCFGNVSAWGSEIPRAADFIFNPRGHGWHLDRAKFDSMLRSEAEAAGAEILGARLTSLRRDREEGWIATLRHAGGRMEAIRCRWLVDATGRRSIVARAAGAARIHDDRLVAVHARIRPVSGDSDGRTLIESGPHGWWYSALIPSGDRVVAFLSDSDLLGRPAILGPEGFRARLDESKLISRKLSASGDDLASAPRATDSRSSRLDHFAGEGWLAVGDAAMAFDPLSSQGILNALYTGMRGGQALSRRSSGDDAVEGYAARLESIYEAYRRHLDAYYRLETRWPGLPFWERRRQTPQDNAR